jgi:hypothetical protein
MTTLATTAERSRLGLSRTAVRLWFRPEAQPSRVESTARPVVPRSTPISLISDRDGAPTRGACRPDNA